MRLSDLEAILTGSQAYGKPDGDSDIDLVVYMSEKSLDEFVEVVGLDADENCSEYSGSSAVFRFGRLNLIVVTNETDYDVWKQGTKLLKQFKPVMRETAVESFKAIRQKLGAASCQQPLSKHPTLSLRNLLRRVLRALA